MDRVIERSGSSSPLRTRRRLGFVDVNHTRMNVTNLLARKSRRLFVLLLYGTIGIFGLAAFRFWQLRSYPMELFGRQADYGLIVPSPDSTYVVLATTLDDVDFWGQHRFFYRISLFEYDANRTAREVRSFLIEPPQTESITSFTKATVKCSGTQAANR